MTNCRVYVRREGNHFVGLCAELREIITARTVDEIVARAKLLSGSLDVRVKIYMRNEPAEGVDAQRHA